MKNDDLKWTTLESTLLIERPWLAARRDKVRLPDGRINEEYYVLHYPTWVNVIAETTRGELIMERQYRYALGIVSEEICAGVVEKDETPLHAAQRELCEETGYTGGQWEQLMTLAPNPSTMDNVCHCFLARGVEKTTGQHLDATEDLRVLLRSRAEVFAMLQQGRVMQAMMAAPLWKYFFRFPVVEEMPQHGARMMP